MIHERAAATVMLAALRCGVFNVLMLLTKHGGRCAVCVARVLREVFS